MALVHKIPLMKTVNVALASSEVSRSLKSCTIYMFTLQDVFDDEFKAGGEQKLAMCHFLSTD